MWRRAVAGALVWVCLSFGVLTGVVYAQAPANPAGNIAGVSFPALTGRVVDNASLLKPGERAALTNALAALEARNGDQVVVVTLPTLQGRPIEEYGYQLGRAWGIGQKGKDKGNDSGALLIVAPAERTVRIEVGYGLEGTLTDAATRLIIENDILPAFKTGDFSTGILRGSARIIQLLGGDGGVVANDAAVPYPRHGAPHTPPPLWLVIVLGLGGVSFLIFCAVSGGAFCRMMMQILLMMALSGRRRGGDGDGGGSSFSGGGGNFGGGGSSGSW